MTRRNLSWLLLLLPVVGCGDNQVTGTVYFDGKPVPLGTVVFVNAQGVHRGSLIEPDGSYHIKGAIPGLVRIAVASLNPADLDPAFEAELQEKFTKLGIPLPPPLKEVQDWFPIPAVYADIETSELRADIQSGATVFDIHLAKKKK